MTLGQLKNELRHRGIDPKDVAFWNPGRFRRALKDGEHARATSPRPRVARRGVGVEQLQHAITDGHAPVPRARADQGLVGGAEGRARRDHGCGQAAGPHRRGIDIANGKQSRLLLGLNPAWNAFQVMSNAGLGMLATNGKLPLRLIQQKRLYDKLSPEGTDRIDALIGEGAGTHGAQVHLGATAKGRVTRALPRVQGHPKLRQAAARRPDRRASSTRWRPASRSTASRTSTSAAPCWSTTSRARPSRWTPARREMLQDPAKAEHAAEHLDKWLGDYTSYTHAERMGIKKAALFYGYLRHSLNVLFNTLPRRPPGDASILGKVGQLQEDELKKLGLSGLPWANGKFYFTKNGKLQSVDLGRANPLANSITDVHSVGQLIGLTPPLVQIIADQLATATSGRTSRGRSTASRRARRRT
jgi:hypothetical protein